MDSQNDRPVRVGAVDREQAIPFDWGAIQWLVSDRQQSDSRLTFGVVEIKPQHKNTKHYHPNCDEVLFLIEGELDHSLNDETYHLTPGMAIHIPATVRHDALNRGTAVARMVVAYSSGDRQTVTCETGAE